jgi:type VI secretion system secreted protein Hcp
MAVKIFMNVNTIPGGSEDSNHPQWIDLTNLQQGVRQIISESDLHKPKGSGTPQFSEITVEKRYDSATPDIYKACIEGRRIDKIEIHVCEASNSKEPVIKITCDNCLFTEAGLSAHGSDTVVEHPTEVVSFGFSYIDYWTKGSSGRHWDLSKNQG